MTTMMWTALAALRPPHHPHGPAPDQPHIGSPAEAAGFLVGYLLVPIVIAIVIVAANWKIFTKAGEPGWMSIIPILNGIVLLKIVRKPWWWIFLFCIPLANIFFAWVVLSRLAAAFGQTTGFAVGLLLLGPVFFPMLGFGRAQYNPTALPA